jgi:DNA mismatch repair protein MutS
VSFRSILFDGWDTLVAASATEPPYFRDLNLDQIVQFMTAGFDEYDLKPFFYSPLGDARSISYRYEIMRDLEGRALRGHIDSFAKCMRMMRERIASTEKIGNAYQVQRYFLDAVDAYSDAVDGLTRGLADTEPRARGLLLFRNYLAAYSAGEAFKSLFAETKTLKAELANLTYCAEIAGLRVTVSRYESEPDFSAEVARTFQKFKQGVAGEYTFNFPAGLRMTQVEEIILDRVVRLYPNVFSTLQQYFDRHQLYLDETIRRFDREVQFYVACLNQVNAFKQVGLGFCHPTVEDESSKGMLGREVFDLALAKKLMAAKKHVVCNDFDLGGTERLLVVSGANQGGKTTFARSLGQLLYLASIGCPVPAKEARVFCFDRLFTHFERAEDVQNLSGKLETDLQRIHAILDEATARSVLIMNESFSSTTLADALFLSKEVLRQIIRREMLCVSVTFFDELASLGPNVVSMVATVDATEQALRTYKVTRQTADGFAYAATIAKKYRLTYADLRARIRP